MDSPVPTFAAATIHAVHFCSMSIRSIWSGALSQKDNSASSGITLGSEPPFVMMPANRKSWGCKTPWCMEKNKRCLVSWRLLKWIFLNEINCIIWLKSYWILFLTAQQAIMYWFRKWLRNDLVPSGIYGTGDQAITWTNVDQHLCHHMLSWHHKDHARYLGRHPFANISEVYFGSSFKFQCEFSSKWRLHWDSDDKFWKSAMDLGNWSV